jgi:hypothetical protein
MNATKNGDDGPFTILDEAINTTLTAFDVATARIDRLLGQAFENFALAKGAFMTLSRQKSAEEVIHILENNETGRRIRNFGFTRGSLFARGERDLARQALDELPEAIRDRQTLANKLRDLVSARHVVLERADRERLEERGSLDASNTPKRSRK